MSSKQNPESLSIKYYLNGYNLELSKMEISDMKGRTASVQYSDYRAVGKHDQFSYQRVYRFPNPSGEYSTITMDLSDVEIDIPKEIIFQFPVIMKGLIKILSLTLLMF